jgi:hypothetical protein
MVDSDRSSTGNSPAEVAAAAVVPDHGQSRGHTIIACVWLCLSVQALDSSVVMTTPINVTSSLDAREQGHWLVTACLLTCYGFSNSSAVVFLMFAMSVVCLLISYQTQNIVPHSADPVHFQGTNCSGF